MNLSISQEGFPSKGLPRQRKDAESRKLCASRDRVDGWLAWLVLSPRA